MPFYLNNEQRENLVILRERSPEFVIELCKSAFDYLSNGPNTQRYEILAKKHNVNSTNVRQAVEALISLLVDATKANVSGDEIQSLQKETAFNAEVVEILSQFIAKKRNFVEGSIKSANIRAYRLVNLEWRLEVRVASRSLMRQCNISITMKLYLHTEPKNENRDLLDEDLQNVIHPEEKRNRKDLLVQTDLNSLAYIIKSLEDALVESKSRRIRNIVDAIH